MICPCCRTAYATTRYARRGGVLYIICPTCGANPYQAKRREAAEPRKQG
jgi:hypothetical protein